MKSTTVAVIGGGISGLAAAWTLHKRGVPYLLLEAGERFGGVVRTEREQGFVIEAGPDAMLAQKPEAIALCRELGLGERLVPTNPEKRAVYVLHRGRLHPLPEGMMLAVPTRILPFLRSGLFSWPGKLRMGLDVLLPGKDGDGDESIASFLRRRFGQEAVERLGEPLLAGIHAGDPERLSILATFPRFRELEREDFETAVEATRAQGRRMLDAGVIGRPSLHVDLMRGRPTEVEYCLGPFLEQARRAGIEVPTLRAGYRIIRTLEQMLA